MQKIARARGPLAAALLVAVAGQTAPAQSVLHTEVGEGMDDAEITPDGRLAVVREHASYTVTRIFDLGSGLQLKAIPCTVGFGGACQDAVAVTNERAVVLGGCASVIDLTAPSFPVLKDNNVGLFPRDVEITPDGRLAAVRGGSGTAGGLFVIDLADGEVIAHFPGEPTPVLGTRGQEFDVDSVVATSEHAVFVSALTGTLQRTRVTVVKLRAGDAGVPRIVFETAGGTDQPGLAHDVALTPDGRFAAVRSDHSIALYSLRGEASRQVWQRRPFGSPGAFGGSAMDSVETTSGRIATISRLSHGGIGGQLDVFDLEGHRSFARFDGDPHDLAITPSGSALLVRSSEAVLLYDLEHVPFGGRMAPIDEVDVASTHTSFGAGLDSVAVTDERAVTLHRSGTDTEVRLWDLSSGALTPIGSFPLPNKPCDVAISPSGTLAAVTGTDHAQVYDLTTATLELDFAATVGAGLYPWSDGVVLNDTHAVAFGYTSFVSTGTTGWVTTIDLLAP